MAMSWAVTANVVSLVATTIVLLVTFIINGLSGSGDGYGFKNGTGEVSDIYYTQITPAGFTFIIWGFIYTWQTLWIIYAWTFTCRPNAKRTIYFGAYLSYAVVNCFNITWIYLWGNLLVGSALAILFLINFFQYLTIAIIAYYLTKVEESATKVDLWLTRVLPLNGVIFYGTWTTIASLINFAIVLEYNDGVSATDSGTVSLVLLTVIVLLYFTLENTILDRFARYVFAVYPVVIWALIGVLSKQWNRDDENRRNQIYGLVLLIVVIIIAVVRVVLFVLFTFLRPLKKTTAQAKLIP